MASFVKLNSDNIVEQVISIHDNELLDNGIESEEKGIKFCKFLYGQDTNWKQTSYSIRKNFAGKGYTYDSQKDAFISPKPYNSWVLNQEICKWEAPISYPNDGNKYIWNEEIKNWTLLYNN
jgi:hypothetical protein